ncbi:MAG: hypothetical protein GY785_08220 [Gammaproteobacteria bacterium]|nr:hypothetical protein [Gammaproteobacteria bacterium]MCP4982096.1 hypothetical protein [Gammaproteobacteria bacterium]
MQILKKLSTNGAIVILTLFCLVSTVHAKEVAGKITYVKGVAWVQDGVSKRRLDSGSVIYAGDQLRTGRKTNLYMRFLDKTFFALGPEAKMNIDTYDEDEEAESSFGASILKGAFRFVSGLLAKKEPKKVKVRVSVGTIGVRGTNVAGEVFERQETDVGVVETSANVMLLEDEDGRDTAIEVSNAFGTVIIDEPGFGTEIADEHSAPSPIRRMQIRSINNLLRAIRNTTRAATQRRKLP